VSQSSDPETAPADVIDVDALMESLRARVAAKKAHGHYSVDELMLDQPVDDPIEPGEIERLRELATPPVHLDVSPSNKPAIGPVVSRVKRKLVAGTSEPLLRLRNEVSDFNVTLLRYIADLSREVAHLKRVTLTDGSTEPPGLDRVADDVRRLAADGSAPSVAREVMDHVMTLVEGRRPVLFVRLDPETEAMRDLDATWIEPHRLMASAISGEDRRVIVGDPAETLASLAERSVGAVVVGGIVERVSIDYVRQLLANAQRVLVDDGCLAIAALDPAAEEAVNDVLTAGGYPQRAVPAGLLKQEMELAGFRDVHSSGDAGSAHQVVHGSV